MTDKMEPVAWMYERKPDAWPPASPVITQERWADDDGARPFWTETPLYTRPAPVVEDGLVERCAISAQVGPEQFAENAKMPPAALSPLANATYAIAGLVTGEDWSLDVVKVSVVIHEYAEACVTAALRAQSEGEAERGALKSAEAWLNCWAAHVGNCQGGNVCTCGLTAIRYEAHAALKRSAK